MKTKFALCGLLVALCACSNTIKPEAGANDLVRLEAEPIGCQFLYKLESEVSVYSHDDAEQYLRNRIVDQVRRGNAYWIVSERTRPNDWVIFGPERAFIYTANVYNCPDIRYIQTMADVNQNVAFQSGGTGAGGAGSGSGGNSLGYGVYGGME
ncbi:MAG: hypothetical protein FWG18_03755 [Alphaproteobacteria bacterium]|nr:hypothetical protein [Alphaproteobacteria bacterium]